jgi:Ferritin-like domain
MVDYNHDDVRRTLRGIDRVHRSTERSLPSAFEALFDPGNGISTEQRASVLGVPNRRDFLRFGGLAVAGAALLAACGSSGGTSSATTTPPKGATTSSTGKGSLDLTLAKTAASLEALAVAAYGTAISSGLVKTVSIADAAKLFQSHHQAHLDALNGVVTKSGAAAVTTPNAAVKQTVVDPAVKAAKNETDIVNLAFTLENAAAQTYVFAATKLSTPALRSTIMTIGGVEARHRALLGVLGQKKSPAQLFPTAFFPSDNPLPAAALVS